MLTGYLADIERGVDYGIDNALKVTLQDPKFHRERPDDIHHPKAFIVGQRFGEVGGGAISFVFLDLGTLGILPIYNYHKYKQTPR